MALAAQLYRDARGAERYRVEFDATLRDRAALPIDVIVEDLSAGGFRVVTGAGLTTGAEVGLGLAGIGTRRARVVWRGEGAYGCEFLVPLKAEELRAALSAPSSDPVALPNASNWVPTPADPPRAAWRGFSPRPRLFTIIACAIGASVIAIGLGSIVVHIVDALRHR